MLSTGTQITWSGFVSPIASNWVDRIMVMIQNALAGSFNVLACYVDATDPRTGVQTLHVSATTNAAFDSADDAGAAISAAVRAAGNNLDAHSVQYSTNATASSGGGVSTNDMTPGPIIPNPIPNPVIFPPPLPVVGPDDGTPIFRDDGAIPFDDGTPPIFQPPVMPGRMTPGLPTFTTDSAIPQKKTATRQSDVIVAPVVSPVSDVPPLNLSTPVPPFLVVPPSDYVAPINNPLPYLLATPTPTPTQTQTTTPAPTVVAPVVTPVNTTQTTTPAPTVVAPVITSTDTPAASSTATSDSSWSTWAWIGGGIAALWALFGGHKTR